MRKGGRALGGMVAILLAVVMVPEASAARVDKRPKRPKQWDERILPFVDYVQGERGLTFKHPIPVVFLADRAFRKRVRTDQKSLTKADRAAAAQAEGQLRALGLIQGKVDLIKASSDLGEADIVGFYDPAKEEMVIRGKDIKDLDTRVTVVHELTHALQDQHFNLDKLDKQAKTSGATVAINSLEEGDAVAVEQAYVATLPQADQDKYYGTGPANQPPPTDQAALPKGVPPIVDAIFSEPYVLGPPFIAELDNDGGKAARNRAFRSPPASEEQLIDPVAWKQHQRPAKVATPRLGKGEVRRGDPDEFGVVALYLTLVLRLDVKTALAAVTGWGGDRYVGFRKKGKECLRADFKADTPKDLDEMGAALDAWVKAGPAGAASVERRAGVVGLTACEAKGGTEPATDAFDRPFYGVLGGRVFLTLGIASSGVPLVAAVCVADSLNVDASLDPIFEQLYGQGVSPDALSQADQDRFFGAVGAAFAGCGAQRPTG